MLGVQIENELTSVNSTFNLKDLVRILYTLYISYLKSMKIILVHKERERNLYTIKLGFCSFYSYRSSKFVIAKIVALNHFVSLFVWVFYIGSRILFFIASHTFIALPSIAILFGREMTIK